LYLSIVGTVIAFIAYLSLVEKIGADKAAYTSVVTPVIAMLISSKWEGYTWSKLSVAGTILCLIGNYIVLSKPQRRSVNS
jgi:drug/metabolite transporter (DMT)-like permease